MRNRGGTTKGSQKASRPGRSGAARKGKTDPLFPYGRCECDGPTCCAGRGPAAYEVTRAGRRMKVCTRCDLTSDSNKTLLVTGDGPAKVFMDFDAVGAFCIIGSLMRDGNATDKAASPTSRTSRAPTKTTRPGDSARKGGRG